MLAGRGRFSTGPLTVRTTDPFGLVQLDRQFVATTAVMVTPQVVPLPAIRTIGGGGNTGEARPHRIGVVGQDDALVREYRQGDDVRRIHWRSTARWGDLMVRREEQAWDPSASIVLDSRASAHAGRGMHNSLEWAVSAAASIGIHFLDDGFGIEIYEADGPLHISGSMGRTALPPRAGQPTTASRPGRPPACGTRSSRPHLPSGQLCRYPWPMTRTSQPLLPFAQPSEAGDANGRRTSLNSWYGSSARI